MGNVELNYVGDVACISLNRPAKHNALDSHTRDELGRAIHEALSDPAGRSILLSGAGPNFCVGGDLRELAGLNDDGVRRRLKANHSIVRALSSSSKPVVAAVNGKALGAGVGLALCADIIIAAESATFALGFIKLGLVPDWGLVHSLSQRLGAPRAKRAVMLGESFGAADALNEGLVDMVVSDEDLDPRAMAIASLLAAAAPGAMDLIRQQFATLHPCLDVVLEQEALAQAARLTSPEFKEALKAFLSR